MSDTHRNRATRSKFRHQTEIDERHLELRTLTCIHEVAVCQHGGSTADSCTLYGGDQCLVEVNERIHQASLRRFTWPWRILQEILHIVAGAERISRAVPEHHTYSFVLGRVIEKIRQSHVHAHSHRVLLGRTIQLDTHDASGTFLNNVAHRPPPAMAPLARKPSIAFASNPSSLRTSSLCSPISGARFAGTLATPCT